MPDFDEADTLASARKPPSSGPQHESLIDTAAVAKLLGLAPISLAKMRLRGNGPPYMQLGRAIRYSPSEVLAWARSRTRRSTSEAAAMAQRGEAA